MITENNLPHEKYSKEKLMFFLSINVKVSVPKCLITPFIEYLNYRYFFNMPPVYIEIISSDVFNFYDKIPMNIDELVFVISPHDRILIMTLDDYNKISCNENLYELTTISSDTMPFIKVLDDIAIKRGVKLINDEQQQKSFIQVFYDKIMFNIYEYSYEIPRSVFDMLYVESEDFCPTLDKDSEIIIHSQVRHSFKWQNDYVSDLLKSDIGLICYIQDRLIQEYKNIKESENPGTMSKKILAIHGIAGSGKDTLVSFIKMHILLSHSNRYDPYYIQQWINKSIENINNTEWLCDGINVEIERFAKPLKECIASFLGVDVSLLNDDEFKKQELDSDVWYSLDKPSLTIRDLHTRIADGIKEHINDLIFANTCIQRISKSTKDVIIINDLRLEEELNLLIKNNVYLVKIQRPDAERKRKAYIEEHHQIHSSEAGLESDLFNFVIRNDSSYTDLSIKAADMLLDAGILTNEYVKKYKKAVETIK